MQRFFNKLLCCHTDSKEIIENNPLPKVDNLPKVDKPLPKVDPLPKVESQSKKNEEKEKEEEQEEESTTIFSPLENSLSSLFHHEEKKEKEENESTMDFLEPIEKSISSIFHPYHTEVKEPEKENHNNSLCEYIKKYHMKKQEKIKEEKIVVTKNKSWFDSIIIYFHPNLLLDKYLSDYIEWKKKEWKEKLWYPYSLYFIGGVIIIGTVSYIHHIQLLPICYYLGKIRISPF